MGKLNEAYWGPIFESTFDDDEYGIGTLEDMPKATRDELAEYRKKLDSQKLQTSAVYPQPQSQNLTESDRERYITEPKTSNNGKILQFPDGKHVKDETISDRAKDALRILSEEFRTASGDEGKTKALAMATVRTLCDHFKAATHALLVTTLQQVKEILGRPSGASPPFEAPEWRDHKESYLSKGKSAVDFVIDHYSRYFGKGFTRASLRQDPPLYTDAVNWLRTHPMPDALAPHFLTKKQLNNRRLAEIGGRVSVETVPDRWERHRLAVAAHERRHG